MKPAQELLSIAKPQNLKAIHNLSPIWYWFEKDVINHKTTKFESNSQPYLPFYQRGLGCYQSQNYKIWKQFTTLFSHSVNTKSCYQSQKYKFWKQFITPKASQIWAKLLLSIAKLQNLKAIHNVLITYHTKASVVINHKTTKFESNSQLFLHKKVLICFII